MSVRGSIFNKADKTEEMSNTLGKRGGSVGKKPKYVFTVCIY
jgi:hypothetical protein